MKRVRCPKCDRYITFDETQYGDGQSLVFECPECRKQFAIRIGKSKLKAPQKEEQPEEDEGTYGSIITIGATTLILRAAPEEPQQTSSDTCKRN